LPENLAVAVVVVSHCPTTSATSSFIISICRPVSTDEYVREMKTEEREMKPAEYASGLIYKMSRGR
jgi:hypothetical protein